MAHLVQGLALAGAALLLSRAAYAADPQFSHKLHLKLVPNCADCHAAVASSTQVTDNLRPQASACVKCHAQGVTIHAPDATVLERFSHAQHLKFGNVSKVIAAAIDTKRYLSPPGDLRRHLDTENPCGACHRGLEESEAVSHAALPNMADCLVCHSKIDPPDSCATCHAKTLTLKPASHVEGFFSSHSSGKLGLDLKTCAVCHGRRFTCLGCH